mmetsp:Transcript_14759/g.28895  ORF Transcript_14759/g.28895 Transcript_14759/m.28895 type:complete len:417 (+) Transcript_14759:283-1533(+)
MTAMPADCQPQAPNHDVSVPAAPQLVSLPSLPASWREDSDQSIPAIKLGTVLWEKQESGLARIEASERSVASLSLASASEKVRWAETIVACRDIKAKGEDRFTTERVEIDLQRIAFCVVADGHNGSKAAEYCKQNIVHLIVEACHGKATADALQDACVIAFHKVHEHIRTQSAFPTSGLTLAVVAVNEDKKFVVSANVGDVESMIMLGKDRKKVARYTILTTNHRFSKNMDEIKRVEAATKNKVRAGLNAAKRPQGPLRGWPGGLPYGRALGDADCGAAISADPSLSVMSLDTLPGNATIVVGSDGLWDAVEKTSASCYAYQGQHAKQDPTRTAQMLVDKACNGNEAYHTNDWGKAKDDITCAIMVIGPDFYAPSPLKRSNSSFSSNDSRADSISSSGKSSIGSKISGLLTRKREK